MLATTDSRERPSRSSLVTTRWSPARATSSARSSLGRRASLPEALPMNTYSHPAAARASRWASGFWSRVDTRP